MGKFIALNRNILRFSSKLINAWGENANGSKPIQSNWCLGSRNIFIPRTIYSWLAFAYNKGVLPQNLSTKSNVP